MSKIKKYTLSFEDQVDFDVYGVSSPFADYRLAWELNAIMSIQLIKSVELILITDKKSKKVNEFYHYNFIDDENFTKIYLIKNRQNNQLLISDKDMIDYFLIVKNNFTVDLNSFINDLRKINGIVAVFKLESEKFDFIDYLT